jgi:hypothetical protein
VIDVLMTAVIRALMSNDLAVGGNRDVTMMRKKRVEQRDGENGRGGEREKESGMSHAEVS